MATRYPELESWRALNRLVMACPPARLRRLLDHELDNRQRSGFIRRLCGRLNAIQKREQREHVASMLKKSRRETA